MWQGTVALGPGLLIYTGRIGSAHRHCHAAAQLLLATDGEIELIDDTGERCRDTAALIPAGVPHEIVGSATGLLVFADAESVLGQALTDDAGRSGYPAESVRAWTLAARPLHAIDPSDSPDPLHIARQVLHTVVGDLPRPAGLRHPALRRALLLLPGMLEGPVRLSDLAAATGISASRLGHLFRDEIGMPFPPYLRWARVQKAFEHARRHGGTLTDAAHAAGFADSAHFTRVCHEIFGLTPTDLARATGLTPVTGTP